MHIAPVVIVHHSVGPSGWVDALTHVASALESHPDLPLTIRLPGAAVEHISHTEPDLWAAVVASDVQWLAGGFSDPILVTLPDSARAAQLRRERTAMDAAGIGPRGIWIGDYWAPDLVSLVIDEEHTLMLLDGSLVPDPPTRPGAVERAGATVTAVAVIAEIPDQPEPDGLTALRISPVDLAALATSHRGRLISPLGYLAEHLPGARLTPRTTPPVIPADVEPFYRKVLLLTTDMGDRVPGQDILFGLQTRETLQPGGAGKSQHRDLIASRVAFDRSRHRGDSWVVVEEVDWDADGVDEIHIESATSGMVVDPANGTLETWDDKVSKWPITAVEPSRPGTLIRRSTVEGVDPPPEPLSVQRREEGRGEALLILEGSSGVVCRVEIRGRSLTWEVGLDVGDTLRLGPEIPVAMEGARLRVDGGEWMETDQPVAVTGHRFRLADHEHALVVEAPRPCELFTHPLPGRGLVIWPHWLTSTDSAYRVTFTPT